MAVEWDKVDQLLRIVDKSKDHPRLASVTGAALAELDSHAVEAQKVLDEAAKKRAEEAAAAKAKLDAEAAKLAVEEKAKKEAQARAQEAAEARARESAARSIFTPPDPSVRRPEVPNA